jgi:hypothetical protein
MAHKIKIADDEALIGKDTVWLMCKAGDKMNEYQLSFPNPQSHIEGGIAWRLTHSNAPTKTDCIGGAGLIGDLESLVGANSMKEATDRLRRMRRAYKSIKDMEGE